MERLLTTLAIAGLLLATCCDTRKATDLSGVAGTYTLFAIDGHDLPYVPPHEGGAPEVRASTFVLRTDGTFEMTMIYGAPDGGQRGRDFSGAYFREGDTLHFRWKGAGETTATCEGTAFTMNNEGVLFAYRR